MRGIEQMGSICSGHGRLWRSDPAIALEEPMPSVNALLQATGSIKSSEQRESAP